MVIVMIVAVFGACLALLDHEHYVYITPIMVPIIMFGALVIWVTVGSTTDELWRIDRDPRYDKEQRVDGLGRPY